MEGSGTWQLTVIAVRMFRHHTLHVLLNYLLKLPLCGCLFASHAGCSLRCCKCLPQHLHCSGIALRHFDCLHINNDCFEVINTT